MKNKTLYILFAVFVICNADCRAQKYANEFLFNQQNKQKCEIVYFKGAEELIKTNITTLHLTEDSALLSVFNTEMSEQMQFYGFDVRNIDVFPNELADNECTLEISQIEMEEFSFYDSVKGYENPSLSFYKQLNGVRINVWLTYNGNKQEDKIIFFNETAISDAFEGYFEDENSQDPIINYEITEINPNDAYLIAFNNADDCAKYFFNFLLNRYVQLKSEGKDKNYYGISSQRRLITKKHPFDYFETL